MTHLQLSIDKYLATVTLNRPDVRNAFNDEVILELTQVFRDLGTRSDVRCIVLAANGSAFCAGADLNWMKRMADYAHDLHLPQADDCTCAGRRVCRRHRACRGLRHCGGCGHSQLLP
jgi:methylglutaconyl-CoA hydratase